MDNNSRSMSVKNCCGGDIIKGVVYGTLDVNSDLKKKRFNICVKNTCGFFLSGFCLDCFCKLGWKTRIPEQSCPVGLWGAEIKE